MRCSNIMSDSSAALDQTEEDNIFVDETTDEALEAAASGPMVTFTLSMVLFASQFCPSAALAAPRAADDGLWRKAGISTPIGEATVEIVTWNIQIAALVHAPPEFRPRIWFQGDLLEKAVLAVSVLLFQRPFLRPVFASV